MAVMMCEVVNGIGGTQQLIDPCCTGNRFLAARGFVMEGIGGGGDDLHGRRCGQGKNMLPVEGIILFFTLLNFREECHVFQPGPPPGEAIARETCKAAACDTSLNPVITGRQKQGIEATQSVTDNPDAGRIHTPGFTKDIEGPLMISKHPARKTRLFIFFVKGTGVIGFTLPFAPFVDRRQIDGHGDVPILSIVLGEGQAQVVIQPGSFVFS